MDFQPDYTGRCLMSAQELSDHVGERIMTLPPGPVYDDPIALMEKGVHHVEWSHVTEVTGWNPAHEEAMKAFNEAAAKQREIYHSSIFSPQPADPYVWHDIATLIDYGNI